MICPIDYAKRVKIFKYKATHPGNYILHGPLDLATFHETTSAALRSYFSGRKDAASFFVPHAPVIRRF